ncbi:hypothetical protein [Gordonia rhizosphera]|uniref:Uncharacterized protein n=1 Tax=Gordonia rhizosphera NBRC 16068 TaxID=1108045 RepID=K6X2A4_9ACTN|nr:hypothetical protein [Gordonia rhizosphera]GAB92919.1 hypothetical protein GORHZ_197_00760 [Gordonia rhizosphera NBRC 16068]
MPDSPQHDHEPDDALVTDDPDKPHEYEHESAFAFGDATPIGETDRIARERAIYEAARHGNDLNRGHALGGSGGTTEGQ